MVVNMDFRSKNGVVGIGYVLALSFAMYFLTLIYIENYKLIDKLSEKDREYGVKIDKYTKWLVAERTNTVNAEKTLGHVGGYLLKDMSQQDIVGNIKRYTDVLRTAVEYYVNSSKQKYRKSLKTAKEADKDIVLAECE